VLSIFPALTEEEQVTANIIERDRRHIYLVATQKVSYFEGIIYWEYTFCARSHWFL